MAQLFDPRTLEPTAWRRWVREGLRLAWRASLTLLPLSVLLGLGIGWVVSRDEASLLKALGVPLDPGVSWVLGSSALLQAPLIVFFGLWQMALLEVLAASASGRRVDVGMVWTSIHGFWTQPGRPAQRQMAARARWAAILVASLMSLGALMVMNTPPEDLLKSLARLAQRRESFVSAAAAWYSTFMLCWTFQRHSAVSLSGPLVRKHGMDWDQAHVLSRQALSRNFRSFLFLRYIFMGVLVLVMLVPPAAWLVFPFELLWASVLTVAYRDIFEAKSQLDPVVAPAQHAVAVRPALG